jgi:precorrin-6x reductase
MVRVLILSGTSEAAAFAEACARDRDFEVVCSLAGRTSSPRPLPGEVRVGGFGGAAGLERFLRTRAIDRLVDATHPFAEQMSWNALQACRAAAVPRLRLLRQPWQRQAGDRWVEVDDLAEAARRLPPLGRRAFLSVGQKDLAGRARAIPARGRARTAQGTSDRGSGRQGERWRGDLRQAGCGARPWPAGDHAAATAATAGAGRRHGRRSPRLAQTFARAGRSTWW